MRENANVSLLGETSTSTTPLAEEAEGVVETEINPAGSKQEDLDELKVNVLNENVNALQFPVVSKDSAEKAGDVGSAMGRSHQE